MAQQPVSCPNCGTLSTTGQRFCSNCGTTIGGGSNNPTERVVDDATQFSGGSYSAPNPLDYQTPPPPPPIYQTPAYAKPQKDSSKSVVGQIGCGVGVVVLLVLALCGVLGYFVYNGANGLIHNVANSNSSSTNTSVGSSNTNTNTTPTPQPPIVDRINATVMYAGVNITIVDTRQSNFFTDDQSSSAQSGVVRLNLREVNPMDRSGSYIYDDIMRLLLPDGTSVAPVGAQQLFGPDAAISRSNWVDFPVPLATKANQLTLRIGTPTENQMDIPLRSNVDVSKYQPKTVTLNNQGQYVGTNWTITGATVQPGYSGKQADKGMNYVIVALKVDNNSANNFSGLPSDYIRLKTGTTVVSASTNCTLPIGVQAGQTNVTGTCSFAVPLGSTDFTFILLADPSTGAKDQTTIPFQVQ